VYLRCRCWGWWRYCAVGMAGRRDRLLVSRRFELWKNWWKRAMLDLARRRLGCLVRFLGRLPGRRWRAKAEGRCLRAFDGAGGGRGRGGGARSGRLGGEVLDPGLVEVLLVWVVFGGVSLFLRDRVTWRGKWRGSKGNRVGRGEKYGRTERRGNESILWRGMTVTSSISQRKAISGGVRPGGRGRAIVGVDSLSCRGCTSL
jgi:hypothetical protein